MRKALLALVFSLLSHAALADSSNGFGYSSLTNTAVQCKQIVAAPITLQGFSMVNYSTTAASITFYDTLLASTSTAVIGGTPGAYPFGIPGATNANQGGGSNWLPALGINFVKALTFCVTPVPANSALQTGQVQGTVSFH